MKQPLKEKLKQIGGGHLLKEAGKKGGNQLDDVAHAAAFLVKSEFGSGAKNDFIKTFKKWL